MRLLYLKKVNDNWKNNTSHLKKIKNNLFHKIINFNNI